MNLTHKNSNLAYQIVNAIQAVVGMSPASLHEPQFSGNEWSYTKDSLDTGWVSSVGKYVDEFELRLADFTGVKRAVAVVNGTAALHICLKLAGVEPGDEVLMPALTFVATANAVVYCGAIPHFIDCEEKTLGIDPVKLENYLSDVTVMRYGSCYNRKTNRRIKAVVPMHTFGHPVDLDPLVAVCHRFELELVEDAAESLGSYYKGKHTGTFGKLSAVSFNGNKIITTGGGGAILTNDEKLGDQAKHLTTTAKVPHRWEFNHDRIGYNYRMPNINAALGCAQLEQLPRFLELKRNLAHRYQDAFSAIEGVSFFTEPDYATSNYWLNLLILDDAHTDMQDAVLAATNDAGIMTRPAWKPMHQLSMFNNAPRMELPVTESLAKKIINIPSSVCLGELHAA